MRETTVEVVELTRCYGEFCAVDQISFTLQRGTVLGLLGPNGAGKSTTIKMLTTLLPPTLGTAKIMGYDIVQEAQEVRGQIGYVPQFLAADGELTGYENLELSGRLYGLSHEKRKRKIEELLHFMGIHEFAYQLVRQYSGGMIRRLEIALALIHEPSVLFLDEPTVGLDPSARRLLWAKIEELRENFKTTILMTTHDMEEADILCDQVAFMHLGHILAMDAPEKLKEAISKEATLNDVFIHYTGTSIEGGGSYSHAKAVRTTISHLD